MARKIRFQTKITTAFIALSILISWSVIFLIHERALTAQKEELRKKLTAIAATSALFLDARRLLSIPLDREGEKTPEYLAMRDKLIKIRQANPDIKYVYTMVKSNKPDIWLFVVDAEKAVPAEIAHCGEPYDVSQRPQMRLAFDGPIADKNLEKDKWGTWLSAYAPIKDDNGQAVGIIGVDFSVKEFSEIQDFIKKRTYFVLGLALFLSLVFGFLVSRSVTTPLSKLVDGMKIVAAGDFTHTVDIRTNDEIEDAANIFNHMSKELAHLYKNLQDHFLSTIFSLASAIEAKDTYTKGHSERVAALSVKIGSELGLVKEDINILRNIGVLHDIGKIGISESVLRKPGRLTDEEMDLIKTHPLIGESILRSIEMLRPGLSIVKSHHERPDGKGYPERLKSGQIPLLASIVSVADAFDAMMSERPYRKAMTKDEAIAQIKENVGKQFEAEVVAAFLKVIEKQPKQ